ncbi:MULTISPECIES: TetR/AcrR family transcriptional regulator [Mycobacterium]|uniref:TetR family transcriptional regulator n=1 Tax=Mycobacterium kiyosense TaxID=2871094 RepID=A0A9P3Q4C4_9MYCO|nr:MULTISPECIES: TetR/AcrR family transcriptional regulator [Mycobacterium]BDB39653.1 TetR family transcriptional regulator [Mycobacterium kiyosense]BDE11512.1 TetR family transcriptional regulator [Mycobacterium sp. 20KCMC460]GLB82404.1 TetR family transcriptional regulator [Mycobacterium kiyosense]GLB88889.1 TetR family transcriptional regulator [Mycobacterium kiyosense]GLB95619.1 TetR family transcriptional regulator [Mycobacterium kiyosense]
MPRDQHASTTRQQRPGQRRRDERRRAIVARLSPALEDLLAEGAVYSDLSVAALSRAADMSRSRFYVYFEDTGDLLRALTEDAVVELFEATLAWWTLHPDGTWDQLRTVTERIFATYQRHRHLLRAIEQVATHDSGVRQHFSALFTNALEGYAAELAAGQTRGSLDPTLESRRTAGLLASMTQSGLYELTATGQLDNPDRWVDSLTTIVWNTLYAPTHEPARCDVPDHA